MSKPDLSALPAIELVEDEPVFNEPWEAQAFAMVIALHKQSLFTWEEWAEALSSEIHSGVELSYYQHWLKAAEKLMMDKQVFSSHALQSREQEWHDAAARTPHGMPIEL